MRVKGAKKNPKLTDVTLTVTTPTNKKTIHNIFLIDASGSMSGDKYDNVIMGVNTLLTSIKADVDTNNTVMIVEFEGSHIRTMLPLTSDIPAYYKPMGTGGMTPLNQAIGETIEDVLSIRKNYYEKEDKVLVNIFTDGGENSSKGKYSKPKSVSDLIKKVEEENFTVTFVGTQDEVNYAIQTLSMDFSNTLVHNNSAADITRSFNDTVMARSSYSKSVAAGLDVKKSFYTKSVETKK